MELKSILKKGVNNMNNKEKGSRDSVSNDKDVCYVIPPQNHSADNAEFDKIPYFMPH